MSRAFILVGMFVCVAAAPAVAQTTPERKPAAPSSAASAYDTKAQTQAKVDDLFAWQFENSSAESPSNSRPEYAKQVIEILQHIRPPRTTMEMYEQLDTHAYLDDKGDFLYHAWLIFGRLPDELSRTSIGSSEVVVYQWKNTDGGNVIATFSNGQLVSKAQSGLPRASPNDWNPQVSETALIALRAKRGIKVP